MTCGALFTCCVALALLVRRSWRWRRIEVVRDTIKTFASTRSVFTKGVKLVILDEADAMTNDAQAALRRVMEKYVALSPTLLVCGGGWVVVVVTHCWCVVAGEWLLWAPRTCDFFCSQSHATRPAPRNYFFC